MCTTFNLHLTPKWYDVRLASGEPGRADWRGRGDISDELTREFRGPGGTPTEGATQAGTLQVGLPASLPVPPVPPVPVRLAGTLRLARWQWPLFGTGTGMGSRGLAAEPPRATRCSLQVASTTAAALLSRNGPRVHTRRAAAAMLQGQAPPGTSGMRAAAAHWTRNRRGDCESRAGS